MYDALSVSLHELLQPITSIVTFILDIYSPVIFRQTVVCESSESFLQECFEYSRCLRQSHLDIGGLWGFLDILLFPGFTRSLQPVLLHLTNINIQPYSANLPPSIPNSYLSLALINGRLSYIYESHWDDLPASTGPDTPNQWQPQPESPCTAEKNKWHVSANVTDLHTAAASCTPCRVWKHRPNRRGFPGVWGGA